MAVWTGAVAMAVVISSPSWSWAQRSQRKNSDSQEQRVEAELLFRAGEQAYNDSQYQHAAEAFEQAYALLPLPAIAFSAAQAHRLQHFIDGDPGRLLRAIELYRRYIEEVPRGGRRKDATASLAELELIRSRMLAEGKLGRATWQMRPSTRLMVTSQAPDAQATVGGKEGGVPLIVQVEPGTHEVSVSAQGYFPATQQATAVEGEFIVVEIPLRPKPARIQVDAVDGIAVSVNGKPMGVTPIERPIAVPAGKHFVTISRRGHEPWSQEVEVARGDTVRVAAELRVTSQRRASYWILGAAGVTALAAGGAGALAWVSDKDLAVWEERRLSVSLSEDEYDQYLEVQDARDRRLSFTYVFGGVSAATILLGTMLYFFDVPQVAENDVTVAGSGSTAGSWSVNPVLGSDTAGFAVAGSF